MCTVVFDIPADGDRPLLIAAVRDEAVGRPSRAPGAHWPGEHDGVLGGLDLAAGGTWLAVAPARRTAAFILNLPAPGPPHDAVSRGDLVFHAMDRDRWWDGAELHRRAGFVLARATEATLDLWTWDGDALSHQRPAPGVHGLVHTGLDSDHPRLRSSLEAFRAGVPADPLRAVPAARAWSGWAELLSGGGIDPRDPMAVLWARPVAGRDWASQSVACVALARTGVRYDVRWEPWTTDTWTTVYEDRVAAR